MNHNRETINAKLRAANTGRGTFQEFANEIKAFFKELQQLQQEEPRHKVCDHTACVFQRGYLKAIYDFLGDNFHQCESDDPTEGENQP